MMKRYLMFLGALLAVALFTFGCGGDDRGLFADDMARIDDMATVAQEAGAAAEDTLEAAAKAVETGRPEAGTGNLRDSVSYLADHMLELAAMPPTTPESLGGAAITDMLKANIDALATELNGTTYEPNHETDSTGDRVAEDAGAAQPAQQAEAREVDAVPSEDDFAVVYDVPQDYDAWLKDASFPAYGMTADSLLLTHLSGHGATASWKGLMVGQDLDADSDTADKLLRGNASITARIGPATPAVRAATGGDYVSLVDVALTNIINAAGDAARVPHLSWSNLDLLAAVPGGIAVTFYKNGEISGLFYDGGDDVMGQFDKENIEGVFRAAQYEAMVDTAITGR